MKIFKSFDEFINESGLNFKGPIGQGQILGSTLVRSFNKEKMIQFINKDPLSSNGKSLIKKYFPNSLKGNSDAIDNLDRIDNTNKDDFGKMGFNIPMERYLEKYDINGENIKLIYGIFKSKQLPDTEFDPNIVIFSIYSSTGKIGKYGNYEYTDEGKFLTTVDAFEKDLIKIKKYFIGGIEAGEDGYKFN